MTEMYALRLRASYPGVTFNQPIAKYIKQELAPGPSAHITIL